ncbi:MAG: DnaJ domain-containing protein [Candidatus Margulisbacteria bacterium]|nr:DnaJ domain-containing protein [Candidatus Margulisiibacteriota bacterium]
MLADKEFEKINNARKLLGLNEITTIKEIKEHYHDRIKQAHPDTNSKDPDSHWKTVEIMKAYELIAKYCQNYRFSFKKEDYVKQNQRSFDKTSDAEYAAWWRNNYGNDPLWGPGEPQV